MSDEKLDYFEFPNCMHIFAGAMHRAFVDPGVVEITLPWKQWRELSCLLDRKYGHSLKYDGRFETPPWFQYMGFKFTVRK